MMFSADVLRKSDIVGQFGRQMDPSPALTFPASSIASAVGRSSEYALYAAPPDPREHRIWSADAGRRNKSRRYLDNDRFLFKRRGAFGPAHRVAYLYVLPFPPADR